MNGCVDMQTHASYRASAFWSRVNACLGPAMDYTQGEVMSQSLWSWYDRHFAGITRYNVSS